MDKKLLIVANWKANIVNVEGWIAQSSAYGLPTTASEIEIVIAPPYTLVHEIIDKGFLISAQDVSPFPSGAYTGEVPAEMLASIDVKYALIGHSERRKYFGETTELIGKKLDRAIKNHLIPIVCAQNLEEIPENVKNYPTDSYSVMYEPFSAISTQGQYHPESPKDVSEVLSLWQSKLPSGVQFLYGGSVNSENVAKYVNLPLVTGFVVGHASLEASEFFSIIKECLELRASHS